MSYLGPAEAIPLARRALIGLLGLTATAGLLTSIPAEESGRTVSATVTPARTIVVRHVAGREYLAAYRDIVGVWTICDGITAGVRGGLKETREGCQQRLEAELLATARAMMACVPTLHEPGRDNQRWAIVSLAYNLGAARICRSTAANRFRARDWRGGCDAFLPWRNVTVNGRLVPSRGLIERRRREREICLRGIA